MDPAPIQLDYAPSPKWFQQRLSRRAIVVIAVLSALACFYPVLKHFRSRSEMLRLQAQALNFRPAPNMPLIERDPAKVSQLAATSTDYYFGGREALFNPACLMSLWQLRGAESFRAIPSTRGGSILVFIGDCFSPNGRRYLVGIGLEWTVLTCGFSKPQPPTLLITVIKPANWLFDADVSRTEKPLQIAANRAYRLSTLQFAQRDSADPSHLVINSSVDNSSIDFRLQDDGTMQVVFNNQ